MKPVEICSNASKWEFINQLKMNHQLTIRLFAVDIAMGGIEELAIQIKQETNENGK